MIVAQSQASLLEQLFLTRELANQNGLYDAADFISEQIARATQKPKLIDTSKAGHFCKECDTFYPSSLLENGGCPRGHK